jgi:hypothetical protein
MAETPKFLFQFKESIAFVLSQVAGVSLRDFNRLYEYDEFLERDAIKCQTPRELALAFAARFLGSVSAPYVRALSLALVRYLARQGGRSVDKADQRAVKALTEIDADDPKQLENWMNAYFRDVL